MPVIKFLRPDFFLIFSPRLLGVGAVSDFGVLSSSDDSSFAVVGSASPATDVTLDAEASALVGSDVDTGDFTSPSS